MVDQPHTSYLLVQMVLLLISEYVICWKMAILTWYIEFYMYISRSEQDNEFFYFSYERFCMKSQYFVWRFWLKKEIKMLILQWTQYKYDTSPSEHTLYLCFDGWRFCILRHKEHNCYYRNYGQAIVNIIAGRYFHNWFIFIFLVIHTLNFRMICWSILFLFRNLIPNLSLD